MFQVAFHLYIRFFLLFFSNAFLSKSDLRFYAARKKVGKGIESLKQIKYCNPNILRTRYCKPLIFDSTEFIV